MNWVGGVRRRVLLKEEEKRRQEQFFAAHAASKLRKSGTKEKLATASGNVQKVVPPQIKPKLYCQQWKNEEIICKRVQQGTSTSNFKLQEPSTSTAEVRSSNRTQEANDVTSKRNSHDYKAKSIQIKPASIHCPFSKLMLQLEAQGIESKMKEHNRRVIDTQYISKKNCILPEGKENRDKKRREIDDSRFNDSKGRNCQKVKMQYKDTKRSIHVSKGSEEQGSYATLSNRRFQQKESAEQKASKAENSLKRKLGSDELCEFNSSKAHLEMKEGKKTGDSTAGMNIMIVEKENMIRGKSQSLQEQRVIRNKGKGKSNNKEKQCKSSSHNEKKIDEIAREKLEGETSMNRSKQPGKASRDIYKKQDEAARNRSGTQGEELKSKPEKLYQTSRDRREKQDEKYNCRYERKQGEAFRDRHERRGKHEDNRDKIKSGRKTIASERTSLPKLLSGAPRLRRILSLSPGRHNGQIWVPWNLPIEDPPSRKVGEAVDDYRQNSKENDQVIASLEGKSFKSAVQNQEGNKIMAHSVSKTTREEEMRLAMLIGSRTNSTANENLKSDKENEPKTNRNDIFGMADAGPSNVTTNTEESFTESKQLNMRDLDIIYRDGNNATRKSPQNVLIPKQGKPKLSSFTRKVYEVDSGLNFARERKDKTPYLDRAYATPWRSDATLQTPGGSSSKSSTKTPTDPTLDGTLEDPLGTQEEPNETKEAYTVWLSQELQQNMSNYETHNEKDKNFEFSHIIGSHLRETQDFEMCNELKSRGETPGLLLPQEDKGELETYSYHYPCNSAKNSNSPSYIFNMVGGTLHRDNVDNNMCEGVFNTDRRTDENLDHQIDCFKLLHDFESQIEKIQRNDKTDDLTTILRNTKDNQTIPRCPEVESSIKQMKTFFKDTDYLYAMKRSSICIDLTPECSEKTNVDQPLVLSTHKDEAYTSFHQQNIYSGREEAPVEVGLVDPEAGGYHRLNEPIEIGVSVKEPEKGTCNNRQINTYENRNIITCRINQGQILNKSLQDNPQRNSGTFMNLFDMVKSNQTNEK